MTMRGQNNVNMEIRNIKFRMLQSQFLICKHHNKSIYADLCFVTTQRSIGNW